jgi:hypothetical protein
MQREKRPRISPLDESEELDFYRSHDRSLPFVIPGSQTERNKRHTDCREQGSLAQLVKETAEVALYDAIDDSINAST